MNWIAPQVTRPDWPPLGDERTLLDGLLDHHRQTLLLKCSGLTAEQLKSRSVAPSGLTLLGLVRHMAEVERSWFRRRFAGEAIGFIYGKLEIEFDVDAAEAEADFETFTREIEAVRAATAGRSLDETLRHERLGIEMNLRRVYLHVIEEYARHNGHADLLREAIDGVTGE